MDVYLGRRRRLARWPRLVLGAALAVLAIPSCDNPACVFGGTCFGGGDDGLLGSKPASVPADHAWLSPAAPTISAAFPTGSAVASTSAIAVRFSESIAASSVSTAFLVRQAEGAFGGPGLEVPLLPPALLGDGRLLVLLPSVPLQAGEAYELRLRDTAQVYDLTGTPLVPPDEGLVGTFTVADTDPTQPRVVTSWPTAASEGQSPTGQLVVVFDRAIQEDTVDPDSFVVTVDGVDPPFDPEPQVADFSGGTGLPAPDTRAWTWRSVDEDGLAVPLGLGVTVELSLSPEGHEILAEGGGALPATLIDFDLAAFNAPLAAELVSLPTDAIGIANLDGSVPLELAVEVLDGLANDRLGIFVFGTTTGAVPKLGAVYREVKLGDVGYDPGTGIATLGEAQLDLASSTSPVTGRFADGSISFAFTLTRSGTTSTVRLLDSDRDLAGVQSPLFDTTRPTVLELGTLAGGGLESLRSDLRGLVVSGRADEPVRIAEVSTALGDNGVQPSVMAYEASGETLGAGFFVAAPVPLDVIAPQDLPLQFDLLVYDRALNAALAPTTASALQLGAVGPGVALPGGTTVSVEVFDETTLTPVVAASVFTHEISGGVPVLVDSATTDDAGRATLLASLSTETIVTVDASGYDLFTFSDTPTSRLGVPLSPQAAPPASFQGLFSTADASLSNLTKWAHDARLLASSAGRVLVESCSFNPLTLTYDCIFGPAGLATGRAGATAVVALNPPPNEVVYSAGSFLKAWAARLPGLPAVAGAPSSVTFSVDSALDGAGVPVEAAALDGPALELDATALTTLDLGDLVDSPTATVEARLTGLGGALLAGHGVTFALAGVPIDTWRVRCAYPGAVDFDDDSYPGDELGPLVADGVIDPDLFLRLELTDGAGHASVRRPRFSALAGGLPVSLVDPPQFIHPTEGLVTPGPSYPVSFGDRLDGSVASGGLHLVTLTASDGRRWRVWRTDGPDPTVRLWLPPIADAGGTPLVSGPVLAEVTSFTWSGLDPTLFLWSDVAREYDVAVSAAPLSFTQP